MNDFTKEELTRIAVWEDLHASGEGIAWPVMGTKKANKELINKIQSMIDNYCEHEYELMGCDGIKCIKCGIKYE